MNLLSWFAGLHSRHSRNSARRAMGSRRFGFERLEDRRVLAVAWEVGGSIDNIQPRPLDGTFYDDSPAPGSNVDLRTTDAGDFYVADGARQPLLRIVDEIALGLDSGTDSADLLGSVTSAGAPFAGYHSSHMSTGDMVVLRRGESAPEVKIDSLPILAGVEWSAPVFISAETRLRLIATNELIVALKPGVRAMDFFADARFESYRFGAPGTFIGIVGDGGGLATLELAQELSVHPAVVWASPNFVGEAQTLAIPNDPYFQNRQWNLDNTGQFGGKSGADPNLPDAWDTTTGSGVVVAVLDDGVQTNHPDLPIHINPGEVAGNSVDDDGNGYIDDVNGWDFAGADGASQDSNPNPDTRDKHGTAVAGIGAARGNDSTGVTGAAQNSTILPVRIFRTTLNQSGVEVQTFTFDGIAKAIYYAAGAVVDANNNVLGSWDAADIISCSWTINEHNSVTSAFNWANASGRGGLGVPSFVASGNSASGTTPGLRYEEVGFNVLAGTYQWDFSFSRNGSDIGDTGLSTAYLGYIDLPDSDPPIRFDTASFPSGWSHYGAAWWNIYDHPDRSHGAGRYVARAGTVGHLQGSVLRSPIVVVPSSGVLKFSYWVSSEQNSDLFAMYQSYNYGQFLAQWSDSGVPTPVTPVAYPANLSSTIAVGASSDWDYRSDYAQYGSALDFLAPSNGGFGAITTTDRTGEPGYNATGTDDPGRDSFADLNYTSVFGGTSAAAPLAGGVGALMLARNPNLTASDIRTIMRNTADKIGGNNGATAYVNGFNQYYGYGRVNANAAADGAWSLFVPSAPDLLATSDWGFSETDNKTFDTVPTFAFTAPAGSHVWLYVDGIAVADTQLSPGQTAGTLTPAPPNFLADGNRNVTIRVAENGSVVESDRSQPSPALTVTISATDSVNLGTQSFAVRLREDAVISGTNSGTSTLALDRGPRVTLSKTGSGTLTVSASSSQVIQGTFNADEGTTNFTTDLGIPDTPGIGGRLATWVIITDATVNLTTSQTLDGLEINDGGLVTVTSATQQNYKLLYIRTRFASSGKLDLTNNGMVFDPFTVEAARSAADNAFRSRIIQGRSGVGLGGTWTGISGITSSTAAARNQTSTDSRSVGYAVNADLPSGPKTTFLGQSVDSSTVLIRYTVTADFDLDGDADSNDGSILSNNYNPSISKPHWALGDADYDGYVEDDDVSLFNAFSGQSLES